MFGARTEFSLAAGLFVVSSGLAFAGCSDSQPPAPARPDGGSQQPSNDAGGPDAAEPAAWSEVTDDRADRLQSELDDAVVDLGLTGVAMGIAYGGTRELQAAASGRSETMPAVPWAPQRSFRIGSVTKTFTAALILLLDAEGELSIHDPIEDWVPGYYDGVGVQIRHLLSNTSGIVSYNYTGEFDSSRPWTPSELVGWAVSHEPGLRFQPGDEFEYSNTNYVLLGMVVEAVTGNSYESELSSRLTGPLELRHTYVAGSGDDNPEIVACYQDGVDTSGSMDPSFGWAAGAMVSTPQELARWASALYGGEVLPPAALARMVAPFELNDGSVSEYGMGSFIELDPETGDALYGHTGGIAAYQTYMYYWVADDIALVAMSNDWGTDLRNLAGYGWGVALGFEFP